MFTPTTLGPTTTGTFASFLDGDAAGLASSDEAVDAVDVGPDGLIALSTAGRLAVPGFTADDDDVVMLTPPAGPFALLLDGSTLGLGANDITGFERV